jgi:hypothetical protein
MSQNKQISLPISLGEAIDKLTILDIKLDKIKDDRVLDVKKEYDLLYEKLEYFLIKYNELYESMKKVNLLIWDMMDILRDGETDESTYLMICKRCIEYNDIRFRVKNKINYVSESYLKEQKSYRINRLFIEINDDVSDITGFVRPIKYYSLLYDEIIIVCNNVDLKNIFAYDPTILFEEKMINKDFKKSYIFFKNNHNDKINEIFEISDDIMNTIL